MIIGQSSKLIIAEIKVMNEYDKKIKKQIDKNIATIKKHIENLVKNDSVLSAKYELVSSIKGMGIINFMA